MDSRSGVCGTADVGVLGSVCAREPFSVVEIGGGDGAPARTLPCK